MQAETLSAIYDQDLSKLLRSLELYDEFVRGRVTCAFCTEVITEHNLHALFAESGTVRVACFKPGCIQALSSRKPH